MEGVEIVGGALEQNGFVYFDLQPVRGKPELVENVSHPIGEAVAQEFRRGEIDGHDEMRGPGRCLAARLFKHPRANICHETISFGHRDEYTRRYHPGIRMAPTQQRLEATFGD